MTAEALRPSRVEVDLDAIRHNVTVLRARVPDAIMCAVVKADAYGHGAVPVARAALDAGAEWLAVALVEEGEQLRAAGIDAPILVLYEPLPGAAPRILAAGLTPTVASVPAGDELDQLARHMSLRTAIHLGFDTGMGRSGAPPDRWDDLLAAAAGWHGLIVDGVWTHLARADEPDVSTTAEQLTRFADVLGRVTAAGLTPRTTHVANSAAILLHPGAAFDLVRAGVSIYGLSPSPDVTAEDHNLRQAVRLVTGVSMAKRVVAGTPASYGHSWEAPADGWVATIPIGYADGVLRALQNRATVLVGGQRRPLVGNATMDGCLVWCGDDEPHIGDEVVLLGSQGEEFISVDEWAAIRDTISYEITCTLGQRLPRVHV